jgi:hypothetical protein
MSGKEQRAGVRGALRLALRTAEAMVYRCGHPRGGCPNHCDLLVKVIHTSRTALAAPSPANEQAGQEDLERAAKVVENANAEICRLAGTVTTWPPLHDEIMTKFIAEGYTQVRQAALGSGRELTVEQVQEAFKEVTGDDLRDGAVEVKLTKALNAALASEAGGPK